MYLEMERKMWRPWTAKNWKIIQAWITDGHRSELRRHLCFNKKLGHCLGEKRLASDL